MELRIESSFMTELTDFFWMTLDPKPTLHSIPHFGHDFQGDGDPRFVHLRFVHFAKAALPDDADKMEILQSKF